ncbi:MAG: peptidoglycan-binding domain-containing protein [Candidatus Omnitrophota bacterium]
MNRKFTPAFLIAILALSVALTGCKGKVEKPVEEPDLEATDTMTPLPMESMTSAQQAAQNVIVEPSQSLASEPIPATAALPETAEKTAASVTKMAQSRDKDIQKALKAAGFYTGAIDGKIGPRTKKAIIDFQKANGLKADGKVGPKTLAALDKYMLRE